VQMRGGMRSSEGRYTMTHGVSDSTESCGCDFDGFTWMGSLHLWQTALNI